MPTILKRFSLDNLTRVTGILNQLKSGTFPTEAELECLKQSINNSIVGASKLMHFINPNVTAIWDSVVCKYCYGTKYPENVKRFIDYRTNITALINDKAFSHVVDDINGKIGYKVSPYRAAEYIMWAINRKY